MMMWYGNGMGDWGYGLMVIGMLIFWALVVAGIVALVRYVGETGTTTNSVPHQHGPTPQQILADRYARREIDEDDYIRRMKTLSSVTPI